MQLPRPTGQVKSLTDTGDLPTNDTADHTSSFSQFSVTEVTLKHCQEYAWQTCSAYYASPHVHQDYVRLPPPPDQCLSTLCYVTGR